MKTPSFAQQQSFWTPARPPSPAFEFVTQIQLAFTAKMRKKINLSVGYSRFRG